jgi:hypothetical protein
MNSADTGPSIESELIDLSAVPFARLRGRDDKVLLRAMHGALERTSRLRGVRRSGGGAEGERID